MAEVVFEVFVEVSANYPGTPAKCVAVVEGALRKELGEGVLVDVQVVDHAGVCSEDFCGEAPKP